MPKELGPERYATLDGTIVLSYVLFGCISFSQTWYSSTKVVEKRRGEHAQVDGGTRWRHQSELTEVLFHYLIKLRTGCCPSNFDVFSFAISGIIQSHDSHGLSSSGQRGVCILPSWNTYTTYFSTSILRSFSHWRWSNFILQVFKYSVGWLHLSLFLFCNYKKTLASSSSISVSCFVQVFFACISHPTFIGDLVPASLIVESCFKPSLSVGTTVTKSDTAAWYKNNKPTTHIFWTFQIECYGVETCWHCNLSKLGKKSFLYNDKTMQFA